MRSPHVFIQLDPPRSENPLKEMGISGWLRGTSRVYFPVFICCSNLSCTDQSHLLWKVTLDVFSGCDFFKIVLHNLMLFIFVLVWTLLLLFLCSIVLPTSFNLCIFFLFSIYLNPLCSFSDIVPTQMTIRWYKCFWLTCIFLEGPPFFQHILLPLLLSSKGAEWSMPTAKSPKSWNFYLEDHVHLAGEQRRYLCLQLLHLHLQGLSDIKIYRCENRCEKNLHGYIIYRSSWIYAI